jgi:hypothetical protein
MDLTAIKDPNDDMSPMITATLSNTGSSGSVPSGTVTFEITGNGYSQTVSAAVDSSGKATLSDWTAPEEGVYTIAAGYGGNRVFKTVSRDTSFLAGSSAGFWMEAPEKIIYGQSLTPDVTQYAYDSEGNVEETQLSTSVDPTTGLFVHYAVYRSTSLSENETAVKAHIMREANDNLLLYHLMLASVKLMGDAYTVWVQMNGTYFDSPVSGGTITPTAADDYRVEASIMDAYNVSTPVKTLKKYLTVSPRSLTVTAPSVNASQSEAVPPTGTI